MHYFTVGANVIVVGVSQSMVGNARHLHLLMLPSAQVELAIWTFIVPLHWTASVTTFLQERSQLAFPLEIAKVRKAHTLVTHGHAGGLFVASLLKKYLQCNECMKYDCIDHQFCIEN